jgi:hypothetical protein
MTTTRNVIALVYDYGTAYLIDGELLREEEFLFYRSSLLLVGVIKGGKERVAARIQWERRKSTGSLDDKDGVKHNPFIADSVDRETETSELPLKTSKNRK